MFFGRKTLCWTKRNNPDSVQFLPEGKEGTLSMSCLIGKNSCIWLRTDEVVVVSVIWPFWHCFIFHQTLDLFSLQCWCVVKNLRASLSPSAVPSAFMPLPVASPSWLLPYAYFSKELFGVILSKEYLSVVQHRAYIYNRCSHVFLGISDVFPNMRLTSCSLALQMKLPRYLTICWSCSVSYSARSVWEYLLAAVAPCLLEGGGWQELSLQENHRTST